MRKFVFVLAAFMLLICSPLFSGPCFPECPACNEECAECISETCNNCNAAQCEGIPIDGGIIWLILGGAGLGIRRIVKNKKNKAT